MVEHARRRLGTTLTSAMLLALALSGGCESFGEDVADMTKGILAPSPAEAARWALDQHDADKRREGIVLLSNAPFGGNEVYVKMYREYVEFERNPLVAAVAIRALARHGTVEDAVLIAVRLEDESFQVRWEAAKGLQRLHNPVVVPNLLAVARTGDDQSDVRVAAAMALGQYTEDRVFQGLLAALDARELEVNVAAEWSLRQITGVSLGLDPRAWLNWYDARADDPFAGRLDYLYPTYAREETFFEKLAFWSARSFEQPAPPAGLRPVSERRTYEDDGGAAATPGAGGETSDG